MSTFLPLFFHFFATFFKNPSKAATKRYLSRLKYTIIKIISPLKILSPSFKTPTKRSYQKTKSKSNRKSTPIFLEVERKWAKHSDSSKSSYLASLLIVRYLADTLFTVPN
jgi:hypothetical protein